MVFSMVPKYAKNSNIKVLTKKDIKICFSPQVSYKDVMKHATMKPSIV